MSQPIYKNKITDQLYIDAPCKSESEKSTIFGEIYGHCMYLKNLYRSDMYIFAVYGSWNIFFLSK